jgi:phosphinothricin acetyltransferase
VRDICLREVSLGDAAAIAEIYAYHVLHGTASYDMTPPTLAETRSKIERITTAGWPFLVAVADKDLAGYAYVTQFRDRAAYRFACENSIYVDPARVRRGIGKKLLGELCARAEARGFRQVIAVIGGAEEASARLHAACGFAEVGRLVAVGWKKGRWLDTLYMQKALGPGSETSPPP